MADLPVSERFPPLLDDDLGTDPMAAFRIWFDAARASPHPQPDGMTLATASPGGRPSARLVLLKEVEPHAIVFYTNLNSRKACELTANPQAAATLWWPELERQVRFEGAIERVSDAQASAYFAKRPRLSQLGAWISNQSEPTTRARIAADLAAVTARFDQCEVPKPPHWGGFRLTPDTVEFWQGRAGRLHDRLQYRRDDAGGWTHARLAP